MQKAQRDLKMITRCGKDVPILMIIPEKAPLATIRTFQFNARQSAFSEFHHLVQPNDKKPILQEKILSGMFWIENHTLPPM